MSWAQLQPDIHPQRPTIGMGRFPPPCCCLFRSARESGWRWLERGLKKMGAGLASAVTLAGVGVDSTSGNQACAACGNYVRRPRSNAMIRHSIRAASRISANPMARPRFCGSRSQAQATRGRRRNAALARRRIRFARRGRRRPTGRISSRSPADREPAR
jgi:hypothetical protein